ncbi:MAG: NUDIX domain-containing protein [Nanoarchaeota archaeon]|nr:NUDIX domain-containing protein [Nanoarchaeota archaeon]MBU1030176.1 NUDIX domain-containing protein [Nanoarchaeota archaeon]MBU1849577.1 NUDIX domain-containing protein [Nanoarchaeota archaeon]
MKPVKLCVGFLLVKDNLFLAEKRSLNKRTFPGVLSIPGGCVEAGESPEDALFREVKEELSVDVKDFHFLDVKQDFMNNKTYELHYFVVDDWVGEICANEADEVFWLSFDDWEQIVPEVDREILKENFL